MTEIFQSWLTTYGPLALGWPIAGLLYWRMANLSDKVMAAFVANTAATVATTGAIDGLGERINQALRSKA